MPTGSWADALQSIARREFTRDEIDGQFSRAYYEMVHNGVFARENEEAIEDRSDPLIDALRIRIARRLAGCNEDPKPKKAAVKCLTGKRQLKAIAAMLDGKR